MGPPSDPFEDEADRLAERVLRAPVPDPQVQTAPAVQRQAVTPVGPAPAGMGLDAPPVVNEVLNSPGQPLDPQTRTFMESRFGHDFGRVRVHTDDRAAESARAVDALAYTVGADVVFAPGHYAPQTSEGKRLLAHELTHVLQQGGEGRAAAGQAGPVQGWTRGVLQRQPDARRKATILSADQIKADPARKQAYQWVGQPPKAKVCRSTAKEPTADNCPAELAAGSEVTIISGQPGAGWMQIENTGAFSGFGPKEVVHILGVFAKEVVKPATPKPTAPKPVEKPAEPEPPLYGWSVAPDAYSGIVPHYKVKSLPASDWTDTTKMMKHGPYKLVNNLRRNGDGTSSILYFNAHRYEDGLAGPTGWDEWIIGPDSIQKFIDNIDGYAGAGAGAYMFGPPPPNAVEGARFVEHLMAGRPREAVIAYKDALYESVTDPNWWIQMITASAGIVKAMSPTVPRVPGPGGLIKAPPIIEAPPVIETPPSLAKPPPVIETPPSIVKAPPVIKAPPIVEVPPVVETPPSVAPKPSGPPKLTALPGGKSAPTTVARGAGVPRSGGAPRPAARPSAGGSGGDFVYRGGGAARNVNPAQGAQPKMQLLDGLPQGEPANLVKPPPPVQLAPSPTPPVVDPVPTPAQPLPVAPVVDPVPAPAQPTPAAVPGQTPSNVPGATPGIDPGAAPAAMGAAGTSVGPGVKPSPGTAPSPAPFPFPEPEEKRKTGKCPTGLSEGNPIEMVWLKPFKFYKSVLKLYRGDYSPFIPQKLLYAEDKYGKEKSTIGLKPKDWPVVGTTLHRVSTPRDETVTRHFIEATTEEGFHEWDEYSPDHVRDLFFEGADHFKNLWPLEREPNVRAGHWHANQNVCFSNAPGQKPRVESLKSSLLNGRWFVIKQIADPPPMTPWK